MSSPRSKAWEEFGDVSFLVTAQLVQAWQALKSSGALDEMQVDQEPLPTMKEEHKDPTVVQCLGCSCYLTLPASVSPDVAKELSVAHLPVLQRQEKVSNCQDASQSDVIVFDQEDLFSYARDESALRHSEDATSCSPVFAESSSSECSEIVEAECSYVLSREGVSEEDSACV
jgi:hypothetical protein